jgi:pentatricopeptide repeat protein
MYSTTAHYKNLGSTAEENNPPNDLPTRNRDVGDNVPRKEKIGFLVRTLIDLKDNKEAVYGTLDAWVAWEQKFPIGPLKNAIITLEREQEWRRVIQVIKWMLSKGQGTTLNTYGQLIRALDMENRAEEAHEIWAKKIGDDLHSVPWQICNIMITVYYRNKMFERIVKLFQGLESFDRKPTEKSIVQKVADAYELLGLVDEKERVLEKYSHLFSETYKGKSKFSKAKKERSKRKFHGPHYNGIGIVLDRPLLTAKKW